MGVAIPQVVSQVEDRASGAMEIQGSLQFNESVETYMTRTATSGNRRTFTVSCWYRKTVTDGSTQIIMFAGPDGDDTYPLVVNSSSQIQVAHYQGGFTYQLAGPEIRDYAGWMHIVSAHDTTQGTASNRIKLYVNGVQITDFATEVYPSQNYDTSINENGVTQRIGFQHSANAFELDGYLTEFNFIDGQQLDASYFGYDDPLTSTWRPKKFDISSTPGESWGTNGFYLPMDGTGATVGSDQSGSGNDWTLTNLSSSNVCAQTPSGIVYAGKQRHGGSATYNNSRLPANYCTLDRNNMGGSMTLKDAATEVDSSGPANIMGTHVIPPNSGKYFWECKVLNTMAGVIGISDASVANTSTLASIPRIRGYGADGNKYYGDNGSSYGSAFSHSGWVSVLFDSDARTLEFWYNGVSQGVAFTAGANGIVDGAYYAPCFHLNSMDLDIVNFGANYAYSTTTWATGPMPEGYKTLCDASLSQSTEFVRPDAHVAATIWSGAESGSGQGLRRIPLEFQPDLVWIKQRNQAYSTGHQWYDSVRGAGDDKEINSSSTAAEGAGNIESYGWLEKFDGVGGFTTKGGTTDYDYVNLSGVNYAAWCWKAGGNKNTFNKDDVGYASAAAAGLTAGTNPSVDVLGSSVGTKQGFSIIKYNNPDGGTHTFPHGLTEAPQVLISKNLAAGNNWYVHTTAIDGSVDYGFLNLTNTFSASSRTFSATEAPMINTSGNYIAYLWHSVPGFSKFGMWTGNQNADGPFSNLGFKPAIVIIKNTDHSDAPWYIFDCARDPYNPVRYNLNPNNAETEEDDTNGTWDWASNGMKMTSAGTYPNQSTHEILYMAWAQNPFANLYGGQSNAR